MLDLLKRASELEPVTFSGLTYEQKVARTVQSKEEPDNHARLEDLYPDLFKKDKRENLNKGY